MTALNTDPRQVTSVADDHLLPAARVVERYGVTSMTLHRWCKDDALGFPAPLRVNGRRYWRAGDLVAWERVRAADRSRPAGPRGRTAEASQ